jgi:small multidrug resistance pump
MSAKATNLRASRHGETQMFVTLTSLAALSFSIGGYFMKASSGLTEFRPTMLVFTFFIAGASLQTIAMRGQQMVITYIVVLGLEAISAYSLGVFFLKESSSLERLAGVALVLAGIVVLRIGKKKARTVTTVSQRSVDYETRNF